MISSESQVPVWLTIYAVLAIVSGCDRTTSATGQGLQSAAADAVVNCPAVGTDASSSDVSVAEVSAADAGPDSTSISADGGTDATAVAAEKVCFTAGEYLLGHPDPEATDWTLAPLGVQRVDKFCLALKEVTNSQWHACIAAGGCSDPCSGPLKETAPCLAYKKSQLESPDVSVTQIYDEGAREYCLGLGPGWDLPTFAEVQVALFSLSPCEWSSAGWLSPNGSMQYPWGSGLPPPNWGNIGLLGAFEILRPGLFPAEPSGLFDLSGNAPEWLLGGVPSYSGLLPGKSTEMTNISSITLRMDYKSKDINDFMVGRIGFAGAGAGFRCAYRKPNDW
jgi:formylglycine-generating enzyme required for sulfatase activity